MNYLWEITNGHVGESYVRCYAWAGCADEAIALCVGTNGGQTSDYRVRLLMPACARPFCTKLKDDGWPEAVEETFVRPYDSVAPTSGRVS